MDLNTSLKGRLRNTNLPLTNSLFPLFEAVVNSIHSIDSTSKLENKSESIEHEIRVKILRTAQVSAFEDIKTEIVGFEIIDNGIGFNTDNFTSFQTLDSEYKIDLGCRGMGRLLWLKAFNKVCVKSVFEENGEIFTRIFNFNSTNNIY